MYKGRRVALSIDGKEIAALKAGGGQAVNVAQDDAEGWRKLKRYEIKAHSAGRLVRFGRGDRVETRGREFVCVDPENSIFEEV